MRWLWLLLCLLHFALAQHPDVEAVKMFTQSQDEKIASLSKGMGHHQMTVTLEASMPRQDYVRRIVEFSHEPIRDSAQTEVVLHRVIVNYLDGDSIRNNETYYFYLGNVAFISVLKEEPTQCTGRDFYFRKHQLIQVDIWKRADCLDEESLMNSFDRRGLPDDETRLALYYQLQAREYLAAFNAFTNTLLSE